MFLGNLLEFKNRVKKKKGRGFSSLREDECGNNYETVKHSADDNDEADNFPQRC